MAYDTYEGEKDLRDTSESEGRSHAPSNESRFYCPHCNNSFTSPSMYASHLPCEA